MDNAAILVLVFIALPIVVYVVARVVSAAYFRSKRDFMRSLLNGDKEE